jgi:uncharacterized protein YcfJ
MFCVARVGIESYDEATFKQEIAMETSTIRTSRLHPLIVTAAASVTVVSLLGAAAITGLYPSSHGKAMQADTTLAATAQVPDNLATGPASVSVAQQGISAPLQATPTRFQTADGRVFEEIPRNEPHLSATRVAAYPVDRLQEPAPVVHRKVVHHYAQTSYREPARATTYVQSQPYSAQHPVRNYVSDMNPVGTGLGAVVGGVLGNQVGGGNGKKLATVAGVLLGGYAGNEVAHDRNPLPFGNR